ncbi:MAG: transcriptional regulator [Novosphingobium sp.]
MIDHAALTAPQDALQAAIAKAGSQVELARICGITQPSVSLWIKRGKELPAEYVLKVEAATGVSRHLLRPDIYPVEAPQASPAFHGVDRGGATVSFQNGSVLHRSNDAAPQDMGVAA